MKKFIKEIVSSKNFKKAMIYGALSNPNITVAEYLDLSKVLRELDAQTVNKNTSKAVKVKKVA